MRRFFGWVLLFLALIVGYSGYNQALSGQKDRTYLIGDLEVNLNSKERFELQLNGLKADEDGVSMIVKTHFNNGEDRPIYSEYSMPWDQVFVPKDSQEGPDITKPTPYVFKDFRELGLLVPSRSFLARHARTLDFADLSTASYYPAEVEAGTYNEKIVEATAKIIFAFLLFILSLFILIPHYKLPDHLAR